MKLTIKTLKQETYSIEAEEDDTVLKLKENLEKKSNNVLPANRMNLIYSGLILQDGQSLKQCKIDERKFIVVMIRPEISCPNNTVNSTTITDNSSNLNSSIDLQTNNSSIRTDTSFNQIISQERPCPTSTILQSSESLTDPVEIENAISNIINVMGLSRNEVQEAFQISFNNPDRAVEYLLNEYPHLGFQNETESNLMPFMENLNNQQQIIRDNHLQNNEQQNNQPIEYNCGVNEINSNEQQEHQQLNHYEEENSISPLDFLRNDPRFQQMRIMLQENPSMLDFVIGRIAETNIGLFDLIRQNQNDFINMINEPIIHDNPQNVRNEEHQSVEINISDDDLNAIRRLRELGFTEIECIEAYIACEKNEEVAANFLLNKFENQ